MINVRPMVNHLCKSVSDTAQNAYSSVKSGEMYNTAKVKGGEVFNATKTKSGEVYKTVTESTAYKTVTDSALFKQAKLTAVVVGAARGMSHLTARVIGDESRARKIAKKIVAVPFALIAGLHLATLSVSFTEGAMAFTAKALAGTMYAGAVPLLVGASSLVAGAVLATKVTMYAVKPLAA